MTKPWCSFKNAAEPVEVGLHTAYRRGGVQRARMISRLSRFGLGKADQAMRQGGASKANTVGA